MLLFTLILQTIFERASCSIGERKHSFERPHSSGSVNRKRGTRFGLNGDPVSEIKRSGGRSGFCPREKLVSRVPRNCKHFISELFMNDEYRACRDGDKWNPVAFGSIQNGGYNGCFDRSAVVFTEWSEIGGRLVSLRFLYWWSRLASITSKMRGKGWQKFGYSGTSCIWISSWLKKLD